MLLVALKWHSHSPVRSDVVETALLIDIKLWCNIFLGILFSWKLWLIHHCVNKTHCHNEYQYFLVIFQNKGYWCYWVSVIKHCIMHFSLSCCYALGSVLICFEYLCQDFEKNCLQFIGCTCPIYFFGIFLYIPISLAT
jgi:hypothetical protein